MENIVKKTPFYNLHHAAGAQTDLINNVSLPKQFNANATKEHEWVRTRAGLMDTSHLGQATLTGADAESTLSRLTPTDFSNIPVNTCRYTTLVNEKGGIEADMTITRTCDTSFHMSFNAERYESACAWILEKTTGEAHLSTFPPLAPFIALQGPYAVDVLKDVFSPHINVAALGDMCAVKTHLMGADVLLIRTGFSGEDGFEMAIEGDNNIAQHIWLALSRHNDVNPVGTTAQDSLRIEAGLPRYGAELGANITPIQAHIPDVISARHSGYIGEDIIKKQQQSGADFLRTGVIIKEDGAIFNGAKLFSPDGREIGHITSHCFSPSIKQNIAQATLSAEFTHPEKTILVDTGKRRLRACTHELNFIYPRTLTSPSA